MTTEVNTRKELLALLDRANTDVQEAADAVRSAQMQHAYAESVQTAINHALMWIPQTNAPVSQIEEALEASRIKANVYNRETPRHPERSLNRARCEGLAKGYAIAVETLEDLLATL